MSITVNSTNKINLSVLNKAVQLAGTYSGGYILADDSLSVTFVDTDDQSVVDAIIASYQHNLQEYNSVVNAVTSNNTYLALTSPTDAQVAAQVKALTQQINGLVVLLNERGILT